VRAAGVAGPVRSPEGRCGAAGFLFLGTARFLVVEVARFPFARTARPGLLWHRAGYRLRGVTRPHEPGRRRLRDFPDRCYRPRYLNIKRLNYLWTGSAQLCEDRR
jgi:hypothetical protein